MRKEVVRMVGLSDMERQMLKAFIDAHNRIQKPDRTVQLRDVKFPKGMNGPQRLDITQSLRAKGMFLDMDHPGINSSEQLSDKAFEQFKKLR